jgi:DNA-binding LacI/PurR family transcriptional regulator
MTIRLSDVAAACGVDRSTASRALRDDPVVNAHTTARIKAQAARLGYRMHQAARALRTGRTGNVLLIAGSFRSTLEQEAARELAAHLAAGGTDLYLATHQNDDGIYRRLLEKAAQGEFDGVVIIPSVRGLCDRYEEALYAGGLPIVFLDRYPARSTVPIVTSANALAAADLTERVVRSGAGRLICYLADANEVTHARRSACLHFARQHAIPCTYAASLDELEPPPGNAPLGIVGINQQDVWTALEKVRSREPETRLFGAVFDAWLGSIAPAAEVFVAVQDFAAMAREAAALMMASAGSPKKATLEIPILAIRSIQPVP